jgi:hypothetical protein
MCFHAGVTAVQQLHGILNNVGETAGVLTRLQCVLVLQEAASCSAANCSLSHWLTEAGTASARSGGGLQLPPCEREAAAAAASDDYDDFEFFGYAGPLLNNPPLPGFVLASPLEAALPSALSDITATNGAAAGTPCGTAGQVRSLTTCQLFSSLSNVADDWLLGAACTGL